MRYHIGLGGNLGNREKNLAEARKRILASVGKIVRCSSIFETEPVGFKDQPWFLNQAIEVESRKPPRSLLREIQNIEKEMGRKPGIRLGPRVIDIDILMAEKTVCRSRDLIIPHPGLPERNFVLFPLREIAGGLIHPVLGLSIEALWNRCTDESIVNMHRFTVESGG